MKSNYNFNLYYQNRSSENIGKITTAVYNLGNLKGIGSSTRIYNNCLNTTIIKEKYPNIQHIKDSVRATLIRMKENVN